MPTYKEVSKIKSDYILKKEDGIKNTLSNLQGNLYDKLIADFAKIAADKTEGKKVSTNNIQNQFKKFYKQNFVDVMKQTINASKSLTDLNQMYFATLLDSNKLDEIHDKTKKINDKLLGIDENGKLKQGGFTDKALDDARVQKKFIKEVNNILAGNPDVAYMQEQLRNFITGNKNNSGVLESYYRNFSQDILIQTDRSNSLIYADELDLNSFFYGGGLIKTSRKMCLDNNGKIFTRSQAEKWKSREDIIKMYGDNIDDYNPLTEMGGYGCRHTPDWITEDLAKTLKPENNAKVKEKNKAFKTRNEL